MHAPLLLAVSRRPGQSSRYRARRWAPGRPGTLPRPARTPARPGRGQPPGERGGGPQAQGWSDTTSKLSVRVQDGVAGGWEDLWLENPATQVAYVGKGADDRADRFFACTV
ncbi:hypothetical protein ACIPYS_38545 [Kitasatospora sp. NPDC089913]|uniref:hypothetical protein n=1 Tax=Kitasatospora sp. NPDC089913 TaxID=3364080 RepID=UPI0037F3EDD7